MQVLCDLCIHNLRSKGENIIIGYPVDENFKGSCFWCESSDEELFTVMLNPFGRDYNDIF